MSLGFLQLWIGSNRGAPVTDANPVPVKVMSGGGGGGGGDASAANQATMIAALGAPDDVAWTGTGNANQTELLRTVATEMLNDDPAATKEAPFTAVLTMVEDTALSPTAEGVLVNCTTAGTVTFANTAANSFTLNFAVGLSRLEGIEIAQFTAVGGGFVGTIFGLRRA